MKLNNKKGLIFWFEGLSGSGKTSIANKIKPFLDKKIGPTIIFNGDDVRSILKNKDYSKNARKITAEKYFKLAKFISNQNINVIFTIVGLHGYVDKLIKSNANIIRVLIKSNVNDIIKFGKKKTYQKNKKNIVGIDIKPIWPLKPDIIIKNNFKKSIEHLVDEFKKKTTKFFIERKIKNIYVAMSADLLHEGHMNILKIANSYGNVIVGLLSSKAISTYKKKPTLSFKQRKAVLEKIIYVKEVIKQDTLDYTKNLTKIKPSIVVHGDDWRKGPQKETRRKVLKVLKKWNGKLIEPKYTKGISSSYIKKIVKKS